MGGVWQVLDSIDGSSSSCVHAQPQPAQPQPAQPQPAQPHPAPPQPNIDFMQGRRQTISTRRQGRNVRTAQTLLYAFELGSQDLRVVPSGVWQVLRQCIDHDESSLYSQPYSTLYSTPPSPVIRLAFSGAQLLLGRSTSLLSPPPPAVILAVVLETIELGAALGAAPVNQ